MPALDLFAFSEDDVRGWCDSSTFARADALQRAGHVLAPVQTGTVMTAEVLGTWSRMDRPSVEQEGGKLHFECTCTASTMCRHVGALVLHWIRKPGAFRKPAAEHALSQVGATQRALTPEERMSQLLSRYTMKDLRALAGRRGLTVKGQYKDEYVRRLAALLLLPENIDAAVEGLGDGDLIVLTLIDVLRGGADANAAGIRNAFQALWGRQHSDQGDGDLTGLETALNRLEELGLVVHPMYLGGTYEAPPAVGARVSIPQALLDLLPDRSAAAGAAGTPEGTVTLVGLIQMLAHEIRRGEVSVRLPARDSRKSRLPQEWQVGTHDGGRPGQGKGKPVPASVQILPRPSSIPVEELKRLANTTGVAPEEIEFVADLMIELDILEPVSAAGAALALDSQRLRSVLTLHGAARRRTLTSAWLALSGACDLRLLRDILDLHMDANQMNWYGHELPAETSLRLPLARMIGHLATAPPRWYACSDLADLCGTIAPARLYRTQHALNVWWFTPAGRPDVPLRLSAPEGRRAVYRAILGAVLRGPLRWLGMVDVAEADGELLFRPRPEAAILADREPESSGEDAGTISLLVEAEPDGTPIISVFLSTDDDIALFVTGVSEPLPPSPQGVRYRVTGEALQRIFQTGITGSELLAWMERYSSNGVPKSVRRRIEGVSESFGTVRLYDDVTLLELGDDVVLRELDVIVDMHESAIQVVSPRLLAVDPEQAPMLLAALTKAGYRPRVLEEL